MSRLATIVCAAILVNADVAAARPWPCLPPVFDGGQRLHPRPAPSVFWLELLMRQHELCWREPATPGELRVALVGNSVAYGMPLPVEQVFSTRLNQHFAARSIPARLYNLGFVYPYQVRDAVLIHEALRYQPDVLIYTLSLDEFIHLAPFPGNFPVIAKFFESNRRIVGRMNADPPAGLAEPFGAYVAFLAQRGGRVPFLALLREFGALVRIAARAHAEHLTALLRASRPAPSSAPPERRNAKFDCAEVVATGELAYQDWKRWNILAYLEQIQRSRGVEVLVVNWPAAHEPVDACYNARFTTASFEDFLAWVGPQVRARGLYYLDLHDSLPRDAILDSQHLTAEGHRLMAEEIARALEPILTGLAKRRRAALASP